MALELTPIAAWLNSVFAAFDYGVTLFIHKLYEWGGNLMTKIMELISLLGWKGAFLILLSLTLVFFKKTRRFGTAMAIGLAIGVLFVNVFLKVAVARPRGGASASALVVLGRGLLGALVGRVRVD